MTPKKPILLHCCCAPCTVYTYQRLCDEGYSPTCYFHNPNIHPYTEFMRRLDAMKVFAFDMGANLLIDENYGLDRFLEATFGKTERCTLCYEMRVFETARFCHEQGLNCFTTTLLYSKYQKHKGIIDACQLAADEHGVEFVYMDFREGWKDGISGSKQMGLYRQQYCGCIFSEQERYMSDARKGIAPSEISNPVEKGTTKR
ncbi:MAG: epoxyqueuosine reductase QueH [Candidatus Coatesbacteria bacterium]|nr:epoxyqueuosine reductase QueH [Candidatus Coatesbacteria bacterium]